MPNMWSTSITGYSLRLVISKISHMDKKNIIVGVVALTIGVILGVFLANAERAQAPSVVVEGR